MMRRYSRPEQYPFSSGLPVAVLPLQKFPQLLQANSISMNERIKMLYLNQIVKTCARRGVVCDDSFGQSVMSDIRCLQALSEYIHHSKYFAEYAFLTENEEYHDLIMRQDADGILAKLNDPKCTLSTRTTLIRARAKLLGYASDTTGEGAALGAADGAAGIFGEADSAPKRRNRASERRRRDANVDPVGSPPPDLGSDEESATVGGVGSPKAWKPIEKGTCSPSRDDVKSVEGNDKPEASDAGWSGQQRRGALVERVLSLLREHILPLRRECQVAYLLERLQGLQVAYLGPSGTYSHHAAISFFGSSKSGASIAEVVCGQTKTFSAIACRTVDAVFKTVVANQAQFGVVPIENSHTGISATTRDLLVQGALNVTGEIYVPVRHHLLSSCTSLDKLTHIYSHSQGFEQCEAWLSANCPQAEHIAVSSTAKGAMLAAAEPGHSAAICSDLASQVGIVPSHKTDIAHRRLPEDRFACLCRSASCRLCKRTS
jgi:prephenate dehydratase